jgi:hypothetical protein
MNYLEIAWRAVAGYERDESDEKGGASSASDFATTLSTSEGNGEMARRPGYSRLVEATVAPPDWDGRLPEACGWPQACSVLGPCPRSLAGDPCRLDTA